METDNIEKAFWELLDKGQELYNNDDFNSAIKMYKTALIMYKNASVELIASAYIKLANAYYKLDDTDKYIIYYEKYLEDFPEGQASVFSRLGHAYYYFDIDKSVDYYNKALNIQINMHDSASKMFSYIKSPLYSGQDIKDEAEFEAEQIRLNLYKNIQHYNHDNKRKNPNIKLNIGYLSSDCHAHTVMNYMLPIWENHDKEKFNIVIFNCSSKTDNVSKKIDSFGYEVIKCANMTQEELAKTIYDKQIDILVELSGYTHLKVYSTFYKPAPVIISYLGYLSTLGIKEIDYILTDKFTIPPSLAYLYTEKPLYLDEYQVFREKIIPKIEPLPYKENEYVTFGSFNCTSKLNDTVLYMWAKILEKVPDSKLLIYRTKLTRYIMKFIKNKLINFGVSEDRLIFSTKKYTTTYKAYSLADISLDSYPFSGMSIAIEAALMGVPTISLYGETMQSRGASRINNVIGIPELNANSGDKYVNIAVNLANNIEKLDFLRNNLRNMVYNSSLKQNPVDFTRNLEKKYIQAWQNFINNP